MNKYRVAVIGRTGKGNYGHSLDTVWLKCDKAEVVAVADENEAGRAAAAKRLGAKSAYADSGSPDGATGGRLWAFVAAT